MSLLWHQWPRGRPEKKARHFNFSLLLFSILFLAFKMILKRDSHGHHICGYDSNLLLSCESLSFPVALTQHRGSGPSQENYPLGCGSMFPKTKGREIRRGWTLVNIFFMNANTQHINL